MNVAEQSEQILLLVADDRFVPALEKMTDLAIAAIEILGIGLLQSLHEFAQRCRTRLDEQVDVIGHEAVGIDSNLKSCSVSL